MRILDLSHRIENGMPVFPGSPEVKISELTTVEKDGFAEKELHLNTHIGTHMDAPAHMKKDGKTLDQLPISHFTGTACIIPFSKDDIEGEDQQEYLSQFEEVIRESEFVILHTKWADKWGTPEYFSNFPALNKVGAQYLAGFRLNGIGTDAISIDVFNSKDYPAHHEILDMEMIIIENLCHLEHIHLQQFKLTAFPLRISNADGSPVRAVAEY